MVVNKPAPVSHSVPEPSYKEPEPEIPQAPPRPERYVERPISRGEDVEDLTREAPPFYGGQKVRFGLFGKIITVMLIVRWAEERQSMSLDSQTLFDRGPAGVSETEFVAQLSERMPPALERWWSAIGTLGSLRSGAFT